MKGWEIYKKDWGCGDWVTWDCKCESWDERQSNRLEQIYLSVAVYGDWRLRIWLPSPVPSFIRQPTPVQVRL